MSDAKQPDLFDVGKRVTLPVVAVGQVPFGKLRSCTPARIGSGPASKKCGNCHNAVRIQSNSEAKQWIKCGLMESHWTHGTGTDIKARWTACEHWRPEGVVIILHSPQFPAGTINDRETLFAVADSWEDIGDAKKAEFYRTLAATNLLPIEANTNCCERSGDKPSPDSTGNGADQNRVEVPF